MAMFTGNWKCSSCGGAITELPFQPRSESGLTCRSCYAKQKDKQASNHALPATQFAAEAPAIPDDATPLSAPPEEDPFAGMESLDDSAPATTKPKHTGNWTCAGCGASITSLPFVPRNTDNLKCLNCFKVSKG